MPINERGEFVRERSVGGTASPSPPPYRPSPSRPGSSSSSGSGGAIVAVIALLVLGGLIYWKSQSQPTIQQATPSVASPNAIQAATPSWPSDSPSLPATGYIAAIAGHIQQLAFFQGNPTAPDKGARVYSAEFHAAPDGYIYLELSLTHPRRASRQQFTVVNYVYDDAGSQRGQNQWTSYVDPEWDNSYHTSSLIGPTATWQTGAYRVSLFVDGAKIAVGSFSINHEITEAERAERHQKALAEIEAARQLYEQRDYNGALAACDRALGVDAGNADASSLKEEIQKTINILGGR